MDTKQDKIVFFEIKPWEKAYIERVLNGYNVVFSKEKLSSDNVDQYADAVIASSFIDSTFSADVLKKMPKLKFISTRSTGYDHIDVEYCNANGIDVANVPSYGENTVAEHAMALILALHRRLPESIERVRKGNFSPDGLTGFDLKGRVIGIIGTGHIGRYMIKYALGFQMKVLAFDTHPDEEYAKQEGFSYVDTVYLCAKSDIVSLHVPYNKHTHHIINRDIINKMKDGVVIINTARGGLIETDALFDGLKSGKIGGAGLDVLEEESFLKEEVELLYKDTRDDADLKTVLENHAMTHLPNVIVTPHNAFNSHEALQRITKTTADNILSYTKGSSENLIKLDVSD